MGSDAAGLDNTDAKAISIHTPAWGVTQNTPDFPYVFDDFNPHSRVGSDLSAVSPYPALYYFNPHSRVGSDAITQLNNQIALISIHTPAWGVTTSTGNKLDAMKISIHTPAWGVTRITHEQSYHRAYFNPHSRVGSDHRQPVRIARRRAFQSTLPRGE